VEIKIFIIFFQKKKKLGKFKKKKKKKKHLFRRQIMLEKKHGTQCGIFFLLLFAGVFSSFVFALYKTKQLKS